MVGWPGAFPAFGQTRPSDGAAFFYEVTFREGLRQRGLGDWLDQYRQDRPPADAVEEALRRRENLVEQAERPSTSPGQRKQIIDEANRILADAVDQNPQHPVRLYGRLELARDWLERWDPAAFDAVVLYELPGRDRAEVHTLAVRAKTMLEVLRREIGAAWDTIEVTVSENRPPGSTTDLRWLEQLDRQTAILLVWAELFQTLGESSTAPTHQHNLEKVLEQVTQRQGWTHLPVEHADLRCHGLVVATLAARRLNRLTEANEYARQIVNTMRQVQDPMGRERLRRPVLIGVLEQVRVLRDDGRLEEAARAIEQVKEYWAQSDRYGGFQDELALAFLERSVLAARVTGTASPAEELARSILVPAEALAPLERLADRDPAARDALYATLAGALANEPWSSDFSPFQYLLLAGSAVADVVRHRPVRDPAIESRLTTILASLEKAVATWPADFPNTERGEWLFLLGRAQYLTDRPLDAVHTLARLAEQYPDHDRALIAVEQAAAIAAEQMRTSAAKDDPAVREAFILSAGLFRRLAPDSPVSRQMQYFLALALERKGQLDEAAAQYAAVPADDPNRWPALLGQARCLRNALRRGPAHQSASREQIRQQAEHALQIASSARDVVRSALAAKATAAERRLYGEIVLILADLLNDPVLSRSAEALEALDEAEVAFEVDPDLRCSALQTRIVTLQQLQRWAAANEAMRRLATVDPDHAGPVAVALFEAMHEAVIAAEDAGDEAAIRRMAGEAASLGDLLLEQNGASLKTLDDRRRLLVHIWRAWVLLKSGRAEEAMAAFEAMDQASLAAHEDLKIEYTLGWAETRLAVGQYEPARDAFNKIWLNTAERSPAWWRSYVGSLQCHTALGNDPQRIVKSIQQQKYLAPDLGAPRWKRALERIENINQDKTKPNENTP